MILKYDPDLMDDFISHSTEMETCIEDIKIKLHEIQNNIVVNNSGLAIDIISKALESKIKELNDAKLNLEECNEYINNYKDGLLNIDDQSVLTKNYNIDTRKVKNFINDITHFTHKGEYSKLSQDFSSKKEKFATHKRKFYSIDNVINIESEYEDDEITKNYIRRKQLEIQDELSNQMSNENVMEEAISKIRTFENLGLHNNLCILKEGKENAKSLNIYEDDNKLWHWAIIIINAGVDFFQGLISSVGDIVGGLLSVLNPLNWDDILKGLVWAINPFHWGEVISTIWNSIEKTYDEEGLAFCIGYIIPEVLGEILKIASTAGKIEDIVGAARYIDDIPNSLDDFKRKHPYFVKPKNANTAETWYNKGGKIFIDNGGITHYIIDIDGKQYDIPYRTDGPDWNPDYPDFSQYYYKGMAPITYEEILEVTGKKLTGDSDSDLELMKKYSKELIGERKPDGYTWHHNSDGSMVLVPTEIHGKISHVGGASGYRNGYLP